MDVDLTDVATDTVGGFHLLPAATTEFVEQFAGSPQTRPSTGARSG